MHIQHHKAPVPALYLQHSEDEASSILSAVAAQARGVGPPPNDLQSQLNDMLDDSASDNSTTLQTLATPLSSLGPAPPALKAIPQDRGPTLNSAARIAETQPVRLTSNDEAEINMRDLPLLEQDQQQMAEMSNQLQVSVVTMTDVMTGWVFLALAVPKELCPAHCSVLSSVFGRLLA